MRGQLAWTQEWKDAVWRRVIAAKIQNQAFVLRDKRPRELLQAIAAQCAVSDAPEAERKQTPISQVAQATRVRSPSAVAIPLLS